MKKYTAKPARKRTTRDPDHVTAGQIDPVAYLDGSAYASLDDDIEDYERDHSSKPFGGIYNPILRSYAHDD